MVQKLEDGEMLTTAEVETLAGALEAATQADEAAETVQQEEAAPAEKKPLTPVEAIVRVAQGKVGNESEKLNIDNAAKRNYTENINSNEQGGVPNGSDRVDRGMVEGVPEHQRVSGNSQEGRAWSPAEDGRGYQGLSRRDLTQGAYSLPIKKQTTPKGVVCCGGRYKTRTCDLPHVKRMRYQLRQSSIYRHGLLYPMPMNLSIVFYNYLSSDINHAGGGLSVAGQGDGRRARGNALDGAVLGDSGDTLVAYRPLVIGCYRQREVRAGQSD